MIGLCLSAGALLAVIPVSSFTLVTVDGVDNSRQEVVWHIVGNRLVSGGDTGKSESGMSGQLTRSVPRLLISHAPGAQAQELCVDGRCRPLASLLPGIGTAAVIEAAPCPTP